MKYSNLAIGTLVVGVSMLAGCSESTTSADLDRVLDVTVDTMTVFEEKSAGADSDTAMDRFSGELAHNLNSAEPRAHPGTVGITSGADGSFEGYHDKNGDQSKSSDEEDLFKVEIDSENQRLIASDENAVRDHSFMGMGTGLLAGMLIGNMMNRQRTAGVNTRSLAGKKATPRSAYKSARSRAGSGSHASGK